ncbi:cuticle collagen [Aphelenchoides avenae]|nr:cuticle collagen [Aphelenchus avenae]
MGGSIRVPRQADHCPPLSVGPPGPVGDPGEDGEEGDSGWDGTPGLDAQTLLLEEAKKCVECPPGPRGPIGAPGSPGETGLKGDKGNPGIPAPDGVDGEQGPEGLPGKQGTPGKVGKRGVPGSPAPGGTGAPGIKGVKGPIGPTGPQGPRGKRNYVYGPPGLDGKPGTRGLDGLEGKPGQRGEKGPKGESGANAKFCPCPTELGRKSSSLKPFGAHADPKALAHGIRIRPASNLAPLPATSFQSDSHPNSVNNDRVPLPPAKVMKTSDMGLKKEEVDAMKAEMAQERGPVATEQIAEPSSPPPPASEEPSTRPPPPPPSSVPSSTPRSTPLKRTSLSHIAYEDAYPTYDQASRVQSSPHGLNWTEQRVRCIEEGSDLASVHSAAENAFISGLARQSFEPIVSIGLRTHSGKYEWSDGTKIAYTNWESEKPNTNGQCTVLTTIGAGQWQSIPCDTVQFAYVCKKTPKAQ